MPLLLGVADGLGVALWRQYSLAQAAEILEIEAIELEHLTHNRAIGFLDLPTGKRFFGEQIAGYVAGKIRSSSVPVCTDTPAHKNDWEDDFFALPLVRFPVVQELTGLSRMMICRLEESGRFPARLMLTPKKFVWYRDEVEAWIAEHA